jgi:Lactonase, 7-bladed beta-propeller/Bacterial Ig-like domain (group 2)
MTKFKRLLQILPLVALLGVPGCGSALGNLLVSSVKLTPAKPTIAVNATQQFVLVETFIDGTTNHESPANTSWISDNTSVATINNVGIATGLTPGTTTIRGSHKDNDASTTLTVTAPANVAIAVHGNSQTLHVTNLSTGLQITFVANAFRDSVTASPVGEGMVSSETSVLPGHGPAWLAIDPSGHFLFVVNHTSEDISAFAIDWKTGSLYSIVASPFAAGTQPWSIEVDSNGAALSVEHFRSPEISRFRIDPATGALTPERQ